ncbi:DUF499 domain-containing protein [Clostridiaceae bacterium HSG29]|nr:DUF499 domain-containing protein [Clostridiaceae bacterium HSG29]
MKTIKQALKIRESVFDESKRDDTLDLANLIDNSINANRFFEETYITEGMKLLFETSFKRFSGQASNGLIKLTQAMGGGKTHNMVALGVMAQNPHIRETVLDGKYNSFKENVKVIAYTGRESDLEFGVWGEIAKQLGKENQFAPYYSPLKAPGQNAWIELLKSDKPTLILLDELPPYLEYCKTQAYGTGTLLDITTTALSNLFNALNKEELHNVCLIVSDLDATYQQGSQVIRGIFDNLSNEINRSSTNIEPVSANTDDLYNILRKRLFTKTAKQSEIDEIALAYQASVKEAKEMRYTDENPTEIAKGIRSSYPFHPSIRDLFARFKENPGFQQTRGFIRLTRVMVKGLFKDNGLASERYLINPYDIDLNDSEMVTIIKNIKPELSNAISHDIASEGKSVSELLDITTKSTDMQDVTKLILMASLAKVTGSVVGLTLNEVIAYIATPGRDITNINKGLEDLKIRAWYLYFDRDNRLFFRKVQNVNAQLNDEIRGFTYDQAKLHIRELLKEQFKPSVSDCYQDVMVFPSIEEIDLKKNKISLILTEPNKNSNGLHEDLLKFYDDATYKNRVMFLTGQRVAMDNLIEITKSYKAIENIIYRMEHEDKVEARDSELIQAKDIHDKISVKLFSNIREAFITLHFPIKKGLVSEDFKMSFEANHFNAEKQIKDVLLEAMKFTNDIEPSKIKNKFETRIFTQQRMTWNHITDRVATETSWQWHLPKALDDLKTDCIRKGLWIESGGYIDKEPPAPTTSVNVIETHRDNETGEVTLKIVGTNGDTVYYEIDDDATTASAQVKDLTSFKTQELKLSFLCVDSSGTNGTGEQLKWTNKVTIKYKPFDEDGNKYIELKATSPDVKIIYTTDGSNPANGGGTYLEPFEIPVGAKYVQAIAVNEEKGIYSEKFQYEVKDDKFEIDKKTPVKMFEPLMPTSTSETYKILDGLKAVDTIIKGVDITVSEKGGSNNGFMVLSFGDITINNIDELINQLNQLTDKFFVDKKYEVTATINNVIFNTGQSFEQWISNQKSTVDAYKNKITQ